MTAHGFTLFDTAIGRCGVAWSERGIAAVQLPETSDDRTRSRLLRRCPGACEAQPPPQARQAIDGIVALLQGAANEAADVVNRVPLDMDGIPEFDRRVYAVARTIPPGATLTYGEIAARLDALGAAREVGQALGRNPFPIIVPCHRVVAAGGKTGGFSANGGVRTKLRLLAMENANAAGPLFDR
jgi:methylated-DNA-[protein]-cysteine S-methyltransferase